MSPPSPHLPQQRQRIIQIHPTRRCNLQCRHCYSSSGPDAPRGVEPDVLCAALSDAHQMGFEVAAFAGGEPFIYPELAEVLRHAKGLGMRTTVTTNGTLLAGRRFAEAAPHIDALAVSVDGRPEVHNLVRRSASAFDRIARGLELISASGISLGVITTLLDGGWDDVAWVAEFAWEHRASLVQIHPLEVSGRAAQEFADRSPAALTRGRAYLLAAGLAAHFEGRMLVHLDLLHRRDLLEDPERFYAGRQPPRTDLPADLLGNIAVEEDGVAVPIAHGFDRRYAIADLATERLSDGWRRFAAAGLSQFRSLCRAVYAELTADDGPQLVNWNEAVVAAGSRSRAQAA